MKRGKNNEFLFIQKNLPEQHILGMNPVGKGLFVQPA